MRSFVKCGIALPSDGSRDGEINIMDLDDYEVGVSADVEDIEFFLPSLMSLTTKKLTCKLFVYICYSFIIERKIVILSFTVLLLLHFPMTSSYVS